MADNIDVTPGSGKTVATDAIGNPERHYQIVKLALGADGVANMVADQWLTDAQLRASDVAVTLAGETVAVSGPLTDAQLRATAVPVSGPLTDTELRATPVPVSGPLTDAQLRATAVPVADGGGSLTVDGTVTAEPAAVTLQRVTGTVNTSGENPIISAPGAGYRIWISYFSVQNEGASEITLLMKDGTTVIDRLLMAQKGDGKAVLFTPGREWPLTENTALNFNLSANVQLGYTVVYYVKAV